MPTVCDKEDSDSGDHWSLGEDTLLTGLHQFQGSCGHSLQGNTIVGIRVRMRCPSVVQRVQGGLWLIQHTLTGGLETAGRSMLKATASKLPGMLGDTRM